MREGIADALGEKYYEVADLLHSLGIQRNVAKVITGSSLFPVGNLRIAISGLDHVNACLGSR